MFIINKNICIKKIKLIIPFVLVAIFFSFKCRKNDVLPQLPAETQTGANTFGCKINGEIFTPKASGNCYNYIVQYYKSDSTLSIGIYNTCAKNFQINIKRVFELRGYLIGNPIINSFRYRTTQSSCSLYDFSNSTQTGNVAITRFDLTNKIISGRFFGTLKISGCPDINLTEGRFDFKMDVYN